MDWATINHVLQDCIQIDLLFKTVIKIKLSIVISILQPLPVPYPENTISVKMMEPFTLQLLRRQQ